MARSLAGCAALEPNHQKRQPDGSGVVFAGGQPELLDGFDAVQAAVRGAVTDSRGILRIGTPPSFGAVHLVPLVTAFSQAQPDIQFALHLDDGRADIAGEGLDLSLRIAPSLKDTSLVALKLGSVPQLLVAAQSYLTTRGKPQTPEDLVHHDCLVHALKAPTNFWTFTGPSHVLKSATKKKLSVRVSGSMRANFGEPLRHAALLGHGISMHPKYMVARDIEENRLKIVLPAYQPVRLDIYAMYPSRRNVPGRVRLFLAFLQERFASNPDWQG